ncbi:hypothetical protein PI23P_06675 [Polaribacter irgensii 23-P]|uniref:Uncharacterized protein n=1 Tax=Polaribacter irgensii 23-P TaxID=313594 RepID=A4BYP4_9FLAO|nr:hypothetical protein PI23P_06675 [Polaribacter irgensii 23-P]
MLNEAFRYEDLQENSIYISGEADANFDANDFILFCARGPNSWDLKKGIKHQNIVRIFIQTRRIIL